MRSKGMTFIEVLVALGILTSVMCLGLFATTDFLHRTSLADARDTLVTRFIHARVAAMSNLDDVTHSVCLDPHEFGSSILISGLPDCESNEVFTFAPLSGATTGAHIILSQASTTLTIEVDTNGAITW